MGTASRSSGVAVVAARASSLASRLVASCWVRGLDLDLDRHQIVVIAWCRTPRVAGLYRPLRFVPLARSSWTVLLRLGISPYGRSVASNSHVALPP